MSRRRPLRGGLWPKPRAPSAVVGPCRLACVSDLTPGRDGVRLPRPALPLVLAEAVTPGDWGSHRPPPPPPRVRTTNPSSPKQYCSAPRYGPRRSVSDDGSQTQAGRHPKKTKERARNATPTRVGMARIVGRDVPFPCTYSVL